MPSDCFSLLPDCYFPGSSCNSQYKSSAQAQFVSEITVLYSKAVGIDSVSTRRDVIPEMRAPNLSKNYISGLEQIWQQIASISKICQEDYLKGRDEETLMNATAVGEKSDDNEEFVSDQDDGHSENENSELSDLELDLHNVADEDAGSGSESENAEPSGDIGDFGAAGFELEDGIEDEEIDDDASGGLDGKPNTERYHARRSKVDDDFFQLEEMEQFADAAEKVDGTLDHDDDAADYMFKSDISDDDEGGDAKYADFFDPPPNTATSRRSKFRKSVRFEGESDMLEERGNDYDNEMHSSKPGLNNDKLSTFEERRQKMDKVIAGLEEENLAEKSWSMKGEISAVKRPENSTLEENMDFISQSKLPPVVTLTFTEKLENLVRERIKKKIWDDVVRKEKPNLDPAKYKNELVLDQQKSKISLSQIYEQEWMKQTQGEVEEKKNPAHAEIEKAMRGLFVKLDALTHFHFTPLQPQTEISVVKNAPALMMEEVAPVSVSEHAMLAPEDVKSRHRGDVKAGTEKSVTERKHDRRLKKKVKHLKAERSGKKQREKDTLSSLKKIGKVKKGKSADEVRLVSSKDFFGKLSDVTKINKQKKPVSSQPKQSAAAFKL